MKHFNRDQVLVILFALIVLLSVTTITYAFFTVNVSNDDAQTAEITAGTMALSFSDNDNGINEVLNFGDSVTKKFIIENTGTLDAYAEISWLDIINTYLEESLTYTLEYSESTSGPYSKIVNNKNVPTSDIKTTEVLATGISVPAGKKYYYNLIITINNLPDVDQTPDINASFNTRFTLNESDSLSNQTLAALNLTSKKGVPDFNTVATTDETADGLYAMEDDYGTSYYFRGAVENNYVYFAGYYWRIIRINGDGSLRIIYDGTVAHANGESNTDRRIGTSAYNLTNDDNAYVGYMYGTPSSSSYEATHANTNNSTIKTYIDNWYKTNIVYKGYGEAVSDEIFCNDREVSTSDSIYTGNGTGTTKTSYKAQERLFTNKSPQLTCTQKNDAFTVDDEEKGNGDLTYPVGLITADEIALAGGKYNTSNSSYYLYKGIVYWSLSPSYFSSYANVFSVRNVGELSYNSISNTYGAAPVINLSADYCQTLTGTGTMVDPYTVE